jgi:hypothetical protein
MRYTYITSRATFISGGGGRLSDAELAGKDFSSPYFYPRDRKIIKKARKEE